MLEACFGASVARMPSLILPHVLTRTARVQRGQNKTSGVSSTCVRRAIMQPPSPAVGHAPLLPESATPLLMRFFFSYFVWSLEPKPGNLLARVARVPAPALLGSVPFPGGALGACRLRQGRGAKAAAALLDDGRVAANQSLFRRVNNAVTKTVCCHISNLECARASRARRMLFLPVCARRCLNAGELYFVASRVAVAVLRAYSARCRKEKKRKTFASFRVAEKI